MKLTDCLVPINVNYLPNDKMLDLSKLKPFADDNLNVNKKKEICFEKRRKHCGKRRKCWLPAFSPFPTMFSKGFLLRVVYSRECVIKTQADGFTIGTKS